MAVKKVILDASIVAKWYLTEEYSDHALRLRDAHVSGNITIAIPTLLIYEVLNVLRQSKAYSEEELIQLARSLNKYGFECWSMSEPLKEEAVRTAYKYDVTIYDASYIALATILNTTIYTADEELISKTTQLGIVKHVTCLQ